MTAPDFFRLTADADKPAAALPGKLTRLMAAHDIAVPTGRITVAALDRQLAGKALRTEDRLLIKTAMARAGLLAE
jgi:hypothetical protein